MASALGVAVNFPTGQLAEDRQLIDRMVTSLNDVRDCVRDRAGACACWRVPGRCQ